MEKWKEIPHFEGYQVSDLGRVRTHGKKTYTKNNTERLWKDKILKQKVTKSTKGKNRYDCRVDLWKDGKPHTLLVSRLVVFTFNDIDLYSKLTVNHKDGNSLNNNLKNLEIVTLKENIQHAFNNGLMPCYKIKVVCKENGETFTFRSMKMASNGIGMNNGYISSKVKQNVFENSKYEWKIIQ